MDRLEFSDLPSRRNGAESSSKRKREVDESNNNSEIQRIDVDLKKFYYEPVNFFRSHCEQNDLSSSKTQIWDCLFQPGCPDLVTTCGGRFICLFNVRTGEMVKRYSHKDQDYEFYSLSWTCLGEDFLILGSGASNGEIRLFDMDKGVSFYSWFFQKGVGISAVEWHTGQPNWLLTASSNSMICLWEVATPTPPHYTGAGHSKLLVLSADVGDLYSMAWVAEAEWVMVGAEEGLVGWEIKPEKIKEEKYPKFKPRMVTFRLPGVSKKTFPYVDSVCHLGKGLLAVKCVGYAKICVINLCAEVGVLDKSSMEMRVDVLAEFVWSETKEFYINIGGSVREGLMTCGDEKGGIHLYKLPVWLDKNRDLKENEKPPMFAPIGTLKWPRIEGRSASQEAAPLIDKVVISPLREYIVAVTNNNIVSIWKKSLAI